MPEDDRVKARDLIEARKVAAALPTMHGMAAFGILNGYMDDAPEVGAALAGIKRGRLLAEQVTL